MEDMNTQVLWDGYGLKLYHTTKTRTGFVCRTNQGMKVLRKLNMEETRIWFDYEIRCRLKESGFPTIPMEKTLDGQPFFVKDGVHYGLEPYVETVAVQLETEESMMEWASCLARFHNTAEGVSSAYGLSENGKLKELYEKRNGELTKIRKSILRRGNYTGIDLLVLEQYDFYKQKAEEAIEELSQCHYEEISQRAFTKGSVCHNSFKGENLRRDGKGTCLVVGFHRASYHCVMSDLCEYIRRCLKTGGDAKTVCAVLNSYYGTRPFSQEEYALLRAMLAFPYKFLKLCNEYYNKRRVFVSEATLQKMQGLVENKDTVYRILEEIKNGF